MERLPDGAYAAALASVPGAGPRALRGWLDDKTPPEVWQRLRTGRLDARLTAAARAIDPAAVWDVHRREGITVTVRGQAAYPAALAGDAEAPAVLFARGDPTVVDRSPVVAIVGTRTPTRYGLGLAAQLGGELAAAGVVVVSGLALGIDGAAHEGATAVWEARPAGAAPPVAVVAGGLDRPYPRRHALLWRRVAAAGALLSEAPVGTADLAWRFPLRNRIMAALADVVVVVECHATGGSLHTVRAAARRGVPVGAVPGSVRSPASAGTNDLLADGCFVVRDATDVAVALGLARPGAPAVRPSPQRPATEALVPGAPAGDAPVPPAPRTPPTAGAPPAPRTPPAPDALAGQVLAALDWEPCHLDDVLVRTGLALPAAAAALERLRATGRAQGDGGWWGRA